jgi:hypothetical protein
MTNIGCSLEAADAARRVLDWHQLGERASSREAIDGGFAIAFPIDLGSDVERLAALESDCCGFLSIEIGRTADHVRLQITGDDPAARSLIDALIAIVGT